MKHLKTYENTITTEYEPDLSKYIIWSTPKDSPVFYQIVEIISKFEKTARIKILYTYTIEKNKLTVENMNPYTKEYDIIKKSIVYQTDTLEDALDILPKLNTTQKYNL